jgi:hypothetical protein
MKSKQKQNRARNILHDHPMLRKGGVHQKSNKALRRKDRQKLKKDWCPLIVFG